MNRTVANHFRPKFFAQKRHERRENQRKIAQNIMKCLVSLSFVAIVFALPETAAAAANKPVRSIIQERQNSFNRARNVVFIHILGDFISKLVNATHNPFVERIFEIAWRIF